MINRVLIRIKVVQLLYSYFLTKNDFKLPNPPSSGLRDKAFAYELYLDLLKMLLAMGGNGSIRVKPLKSVADNAVVAALSSNLEIKESLKGVLEGYGLIEKIIPEIADSVVQSPAYRSFVRLKKRDVTTDTNYLVDLLNNVIKPDTTFFETARQIADFTIAGYDEGFRMAVDTIKSFCDSSENFNHARNSLEASLDKGYDLYISLLEMISEMTDMQAIHLDNLRTKHLPTFEDLNPNTKFIDNRLAFLISQSPDIAGHCKQNNFTWETASPGLLKRLLSRVVNSDIYADYMASETRSLSEDCEFWRNIMKKVIFPSDDLAEALENISVFWNDDINIMDSFVLKTIKRVESDNELKVLPKYKDEEDARFGAELFRFAVKGRDEYREVIDRFIDPKQWDSERLAFMDIVIMITAIAEILNYPAIPLAVTLNEYIEIANCYSTPKSGQFVNGILYSVIGYYKDNGMLNKN